MIIRKYIHLGKKKQIRPFKPFHFQDLICNSPYCLPNNSYDVSSENVVLNHLIIPFLIFFFTSSSLVCLILF